jgi:hypothetical protein
MRQCSLAGLRFPKNARFDVSCEEKWRLRSVACIMGGRPALAPPNVCSLTEKSLVSLGTGPACPLL